MFSIFGLSELFSNIEDFSVTGKGKRNKILHQKKPNIKILGNPSSKNESKENTDSATDNDSYEENGNVRYRRGRRYRRRRDRRYKNTNYFYNYPGLWVPLTYPSYYNYYYPYGLYPPYTYSSRTYPSYEYPYSNLIEQPLQIEPSNVRLSHSVAKHLYVEPLQNTKSENILHEKNYQQTYLFIMFFLLCVLLFILVIIIVFKNKI